MTQNQESKAKLLWRPTKTGSNLERFMQFLQSKTSLAKAFSNYAELHQWSVGENLEFWQLALEFLELKWQSPNYDGVLKIHKAPHELSWFSGAKLNYAQNLLESVEDEDQIAVIAASESEPTKIFTYAELKSHVWALATHLKNSGIKKGDRVAAVVSNNYEAIVGLLASSSIGAVWLSCSPDFGETAILDRLTQCDPSVLLYSPDYVYMGKKFDCRAKVNNCIPKLPSLKIILETQKIFALKKIQTFDYERMEFNDPLYILFSSGTTGKPKCIVHGAGRALLQHKKELSLHCDLKSGETIFYFTTTGWMMWNWLVSSLSLGASVVVWDGSPMADEGQKLWTLIEEFKVNIFGTSPRYLQALAASKIRPKNQYNLDALKCVLSTGAPLLAGQFEWVYENIKSDLHLASISGGTDIVSCFILGNPISPVYAGQLQGAGLGMSVEVWNTEGKRVFKEQGELVCTKPFISMPVGFWNDPDGSMYKSAYFERFAGVWTHGDFLEQTAQGGFVISGRSDATLNPSGVRIGTAELYRVVENLDGIADSLAISIEWQDDTHIALFVKLSKDNLDQKTKEAILADIKLTIKNQLSPRHVPKFIYFVKDIPYTRSGKKVELSVQKIFMNQEVQNIASLQNPECLQEYISLKKGFN